MVEDAAIERAERILGHTFRDRSLLAQALVHASRTDSRLASNERLEFLGDAVLGLVTCEEVFGRYPDLLEGEMTKIKSLVVSRESCARIARTLDLESLLVLGKGMQGQHQLPGSLAAAVFESVIAAIYLDGGFEAATRFIRPLIGPLIARAERSGHQQNFKSLLQQHAQKMELDSPQYRVLDEKGPDHAKCFKVAVEMGDQRFEPCWGPSKKQAEQHAARTALEALGILAEGERGELVVVEDGAE
ncbi:MAG: ribonuclease III [Phycisphaeraceae bacterium]|nr:ribonuclease III [Phycisphaeraceae bacterium]